LLGLAPPEKSERYLLLQKTIRDVGFRIKEIKKKSTSIQKLERRIFNVRKKKLSDYIRHLTSNDKKTLSQKALKASEEVGELAKCVLPFDNAPGTIHRFVGRKKIIEEVCDTILTVLSIAYELEATDDEIEEMLNLKSKKWADLQAREGKVKYPIPYEIHITVDFNESFDTLSSKDKLEYFKENCLDIKIKPILLDLHLKDGAVFKDLMTSSVFMGDNRGAFQEMKRISDGLNLKGWKVIREKIETIPWHPAAPSEKHQQPIMPEHCYFECHLNVCAPTSRLEELAQIACEFGARKSQNIFKKVNDDIVNIMITYRDYEKVFEKFKSHLDKIKNKLSNEGFEVEKEIVEFSIYDTKMSHDAEWILG